MADAPLSGGLLWTVVLLLGAGTYGLRLSFIGLHERLDEFPPWVEGALIYVPAAVMAALVAPSLFTLDGTVGGRLNLRVLAGGIAALVVWRTENMLATIGAGMAVLWVGSYLLG